MRIWHTGEPVTVHTVRGVPGPRDTCVVRHSSQTFRPERRRSIISGTTWLRSCTKALSERPSKAGSHWQDCTRLQALGSQLRFKLARWAYYQPVLGKRRDGLVRETVHAVQEAWLRELLLTELAPSKLEDIFAKDGLFFVGEFVVAVTATACRPELVNGACERKVQLQ